MRKGGTTKQDMLGDYTNVLNHVVDVISKLTTDDECCSVTSLTLPETIATDSSSFLCGGGSVNLHEDNQKWIDDDADSAGYWKRDEDEYNRDEVDSDDELSISSDCVPLHMTDDDAIDEIDFTRELMGYVEGFEAHETPIGRIQEEDYAPVPSIHTIHTIASRSTKSTTQRLRRPPLPTRARSQGTRNSASAPTKQSRGHRRQRSGGSIPTTVMEKEDPPGIRRRPSNDHYSLPERRMITCCSCQRRMFDGEVCDCGKYEI